MALSFVFLCEFGRRTLGKLQCRGPGRWLYLPLLALAASGALGGFAGLQATTRYALALSGGLWAAWALYRLHQKDERSRGFLAVAAIGMAAYALAAGAIVPNAPFFPASVLNADGFHSAVGVPIQLFRTTLGVLIATALWAYAARLRRNDLPAAENRGVAPLGYGLAIMLAVTLAAGWRFAEFASDWSDDEVRDILQVQAGTAAAGFSPEELAPLRENTLDWDDANYRHLRGQMQAVYHANSEVRSLRLLVLRGGKTIEVVTVDAKNPGRPESGAAYERPPKELLESFSSGKLTTLGPYRSASGNLLSAFAPIRDSRTHAVAGVLVVDISAEHWKRSVAEYRLTAIFVTLLLVLLVIYFFIVHERMWRSAQLTMRSESRLAAAQRMAHIGSWSYDHWSRRMVWSEELFHIYRRDPSLGAPQGPSELRAVTHPEDWPRLRSTMRQAVEEGADHQLEFRVLRPDGSLRQVETTVHASRGDDGKVVALTGTVQDITERRRTELALIDSAAQLRLFADNVPAMTVSLDENLRFLFANKRYAEFFGFDPADVVGRHLSEVVGEEAYREIEGYFAQALQGQTVTYERTRKLANGEPRYLEVNLLPHIGDQGKVLGCFVVTKDITEHKLAEERIQRVAHHDSLTGLPNRLLFNDRLSQAINLAKRDSRQFALLYLDLDKFKPVNDTLGHTAGDELLQAVAARIRRQVRGSDTVARVGGDEFTVILSDVARREDAETVARKIIAAVVTPFQIGSEKRRVEIGTSIGIALYPADGADAGALVKAADAAMYGAKQRGNSFHFFAAKPGTENAA
ncbi:MAG: diguanylate cyclase [Sulfuritalea sp.]|nr:diguanylate cyclase [Sulfuritalea sp.]